MKQPKGHAIIWRMKIGYARASTDEQDLGLQRDALETAGCKVIYQDEGTSGIAKERHGLSQALTALGIGDTAGRVEARPAGALAGLPV